VSPSLRSNGFVLRQITINSSLPIKTPSNCGKPFKKAAPSFNLHYSTRFA